MKDIETRHGFVERRAQGKSLRAVADELGIGLQTAVRWDHELKEQIENRKAMELNALLERYQLTMQAKIERYGAELKRLTKELQERDLAEVPTPKLYDILLKLHARVEEVCPALTVRGDDEVADQKALRELVDSRRTRKASATIAQAGRQSNCDRSVCANDLVTEQLSTLQRFKAGEINERAAMTEIALVNSLLKGIELTDLAQRIADLEAAPKIERRHATWQVSTS